MGIASGTAKALGSTASAAANLAGALGGAAVGATAGAARGAVQGAYSGAKQGVDTPTAIIVGTTAAALAGIAEWPLVVAGGVAAGVVYVVGHAGRHEDSSGDADDAGAPETGSDSAETPTARTGDKAGAARRSGTVDERGGTRRAPTRTPDAPPSGEAAASRRPARAGK